ncbi:MAG: CpcT/CpeT family chromophore lyase [Steroidobacteraceae bacterium]|jgi:hypothetical protein
MRLVMVSILVSILSISSSVVRADDSSLHDLTRLLVGDFFSAADGGVKEGRPIYMRVRAIQAPMPNRIALYAEMRHDGPDGELYRQRAYLFDAASTVPIVMQALTFDDQSDAAALANDPSAWVNQNLVTKPALVEGCDTRWIRDGEGFVGSVDPATCIITGKRGDRRRIESKTLITTQSVGQLERGYDIDGKLLFGNAGGELYIWPRVR